jgi:hypothetical protein
MGKHKVLPYLSKHKVLPHLGEQGFTSPRQT